MMMKFTYASGTNPSNGLVQNYAPQAPAPQVPQQSMIQMLPNISQNVVLRNNRGTPCMQFGASRAKVGCGCGGK